MIQEHKIPNFGDHGREGQNGFGWKSMKIYDSKFVNEKTWSVCFKDMMMLKPFLFFGGCFFDTNSFDDVYF